jgi:hypothetical protein
MLLSLSLLKHWSATASAVLLQLVLNSLRSARVALL